MSASHTRPAPPTPPSSWLPYIVNFCLLRVTLLRLHTVTCRHQVMCLTYIRNVFFFLPNNNLCPRRIERKNNISFATNGIEILSFPPPHTYLKSRHSEMVGYNLWPFRPIVKDLRPCWSIKSLIHLIHNYMNRRAVYYHGHLTTTYT